MRGKLAQMFSSVRTENARDMFAQRVVRKQLRNSGRQVKMPYLDLLFKLAEFGDGIFARYTINAQTFYRTFKGKTYKSDIDADKCFPC